jgi:superfamily II DNA/RNA helicase
MSLQTEGTTNVTTLDLALPADDQGLPGAEEFTLLGLPRPLVNGLARQGITEPFPIQRAAIPDVLAGKDVLGRGQTGSGKTLAFGLPLMARLAGDKARPGRPRGIVLVPTRELALQVTDALEPLGRGLCLRMKTVVGGMSMGRQIEALRRGVEIVVATPGRLTDLIQQGECSLDEVLVTVLDEADHMCDLGFFPVVSALLARTPADGQRLLFSATLDGDVDKLVRRFLNEPVTHSVAPATSPVETMEHHIVQVSRDDKFPIIAEIANRKGRTIMFVRTQHMVDRLVTQLARVGVRAGGLHGGKRQNQRTRILADYREGAVDVLVCTDVAARGIHVDDVSLVLHVDPPQDHKSYLHRGGRTARAGERGTVMTLVLPSERRSTDQLARRAGVHPFRLKATPGHPRLAEVAGATAPSGEPVAVWEPRIRESRRARGDGEGGGRRPRRVERRRGDAPLRERGTGRGEGEGFAGGRERKAVHGDREPLRPGRDSFRGDRETLGGARDRGDRGPFQDDRDSFRKGSEQFRGDHRQGGFRRGRGGAEGREPFRGDRDRAPFRTGSGDGHGLHGESRADAPRGERGSVRPARRGDGHGEPRGEFRGERRPEGRGEGREGRGPRGGGHRGWSAEHRHGR